MKCHICDGPLTSFVIDPRTSKVEPCNTCIQASLDLGDIIGLDLVLTEDKDLEILTESIYPGDLSST